MSLPLRAEAAWAAGFFDGEGTTCATRSSAALMLSISQVEREPIERFAAAIGESAATLSVAQPFGGISKQPIRRLRLYGDRAIAALKILWPYLSGPKKDQALRALIRYGFRSVGHRGGLDRCPRGHSMSNAYRDPDGSRECATCRELRRNGRLPKARLSAFEAGVLGRQYVPPEMERARQAVAWTFEMEENEYEPTIQT